MDWSEYLQTLGVDFNSVKSDLLNRTIMDMIQEILRRSTADSVQMKILKRSVKICIKHNVKIVLDGVFNHVGRGFWAFKDVQEKKWDSPYKDWFHISFDGNSCYNDGFWYEGWEGHFELVKLNLRIRQS